MAIWLTDPNGNRLLVNKRYEEDTESALPTAALQRKSKQYAATLI